MVERLWRHVWLLGRKANRAFPTQRTQSAVVTGRSAGP